jgi:hypothetical protein
VVDQKKKSEFAEPLFYTCGSRLNAPLAVGLKYEGFVMYYFFFKLYICSIFFNKFQNYRSTIIKVGFFYCKIFETLICNLQSDK